MTYTLSFMSANFVARETGWQLKDWMTGDRATNAWFQPIETYAERIGALTGHIRGLGFDAIDLWTAHLNPAWATPAHIAIAQRALADNQLRLISLAGGFGDTPQALAASCQLANALGITILGGGAGLLHSDRAAALSVLREHHVMLGIENHPEKSADEVLAQIGADSDVVASALDTGSFASEGCDVVDALTALMPHLVHIHFRDVAGLHIEDSCEPGTGCVPFAACIQVMKRAGYTGAISIEHEPPDRDPSAECVSGAAFVRRLLA
jgi:L-ribulose-5-phosphate 3-epimerase